MFKKTVRKPNTKTPKIDEYWLRPKAKRWRGAVRQRVRYVFSYISAKSPFLSFQSKTYLFFSEMTEAFIFLVVLLGVAPFVWMK